MRKKRVLVSLLLSASLSLLVCSQTNAQASLKAQGQQTVSTDWNAVGQALGKAGSQQPGDVYKVSLPRGDLQVTVDGVQLKPALALGSWVAFKKMKGNDAMVMGDLVLTETEVEPVMLALQQGGIEQTALHNHVLEESPRVMYMHINGRGDALKLAQTIHAALSLTKTPLGNATSQTQQSTPADTSLDIKAVEQIMGYSSKQNGGVYQFSIPRSETIMDGSMEVPPAMGVATAINFQPTGTNRAAITGDFVLVASEVNPVIRALRENGIFVTALHSHMLTETPRLFFMHFWANDDAQKLARGLRAALDRMNNKK